jgi:HSP20 family protein
MTLNRWDPLRDLLNFHERAHRLVAPTAEEVGARRRAQWCPAVDVLETPEAYIFRVELPGVGKDNIEIEVRGNRLSISGERFLEAKPKIAAYHSIERAHGFFRRNFTLPGEVDPDRARARYEEGVLEIYLPKTEEKREPTITVVCLS